MSIANAFLVLTLPLLRKEREQKPKPPPIPVVIYGGVALQLVVGGNRVLF
jgi:hypothetical protein